LEVKVVIVDAEDRTKIVVSGLYRTFVGLMIRVTFFALSS
jgi:hypothetical protein